MSGGQFAAWCALLGIHLLIGIWIGWECWGRGIGGKGGADYG